MIRSSRAVRVRCLVLPLILLLSGATERAAAAEPRTERAIERALEEYVHAKYEGNDRVVRSRAHHDIARRAVSDTYWGQPSDEWVRPYTHDHLQFYGTPYNQTRRDDPDEGRCEIEIFDIEERTASAVVVMDDVVDYVHMILFDGKWVIGDSAVIILDSVGADVPQPSDEDKDTIEQLARDYCVGFYEIDGDKVQNTCHPTLSKRVVERAPNTDFDYLRGITYEEIRILGETFNKEWGFPTDSRCEIEVYEIRGNVAAVKMTATVWFDYFHMMRVNGEWRIVNIMFEGLPEDRWVGVPARDTENG
jgi:hypothetical protein